MLTTVAWRIGQDTTYALEGSAFVAGAAVQWLRDCLGIIATAAEVEALANEVPDSGGVVFVPAFVGLGAPHWQEYARGAILHLTRGTTRAHIARACLEGICLQNADIISAMDADRGQPVARLKVDGGACRNDLLMQLQADITGREVIRPVHIETTSLGAAFLAGVGAGVWAGLTDLLRVWQAERRFVPNMADADRQRLERRWLDAVGRVSPRAPEA
jgi:glycerol kinase